MKGKKYQSLLAGLTILWLSILLAPKIAISQENTPSLEEKQKQISQQIQRLEQELSQAKSQAKTLSSQINYFDNQIKLTVLQITKSEKDIETLEKEIKTLNQKIDNLDASLQYLSKIFVTHVLKTYKSGLIKPINLLLSSSSFSSFISNFKYIQAVQLNDKRLLFKMQQTRNSYDHQKNKKAQKQNELEKIKNQLESQRLALAQQRADKQILLNRTKNDEQRFQKLLAAALAEKSAIETAIKQAVSQLTDGTPVKKGETIALIGNSGAPCCSTGPHLHFEIRQNNKHINPAQFLKNISPDYADDSIAKMQFTGDWDWPISDPYITQEYGMSYWARLGWYGGGPHTGIDMNSHSSSIIRAPKDGTLYKGSSKCKGGCQINYVAIDHGNNIFSWYWHVQ